MSESPAVGGGLPAADVFIAHRRRILATIAPAAAEPAEPAAPPVQPAMPDDDYEAHPPVPADDGFGVDGLSEDHAADASPGFLQFPSSDDDDLDDDEDDEDHAPQPVPAAAPRARSLKQRIGDVDWKSPKVLIGALAALVVVAVMIVVFKPSPASAPPLTISSAPSPTQAPPPPTPVDQPIKIEAASAKCPAGSSEAANAFDGQTDTAWTCKMTYGPGTILTVDLGDVYVISKVTITPGFNKIGASGDEWSKYQTVTRVRWLFGDYSPAKPCTLDNNCLEQNTNNSREEVPAAVIPNKKTSTVKAVILKTTPPPSDTGILTDPNGGADSFAISELQIWGHTAG